jgi:Carboxypeptidase regulatory-like domain
MRHASRLGLLLFLGAAALFGQTTSITGVVTDPTGAVIPSASITITSIATGAQRSDVSDNQGRYTISQVVPGPYTLSAKSSGFAEVKVARIDLLVNQPATLPITFEKLGSTTETVQVEAAAEQVNTTDASIGNAIGTQAIIEMPMYARNVAGLLAFQPGVTSFGSFGSGNLDFRSGSVNGGKSDQSNVTLDGVDVADQNTRQAFTSVLRVTLDSVEEFRTVTSNGDAATGRGSGADVSLVTKSGTNDFHGSLYEYRRGTETAANSFFNNRSGVPIAPLLINVFGGSAGGPIKKNKAFFFINYEGRRDASAVSVTRTVPTETMKQGILEYHNTAGQLVQVTPSQIQQIDPAGAGINPAALKALQSMPVGNNNSVGDGLNSTGFTFNAPGHSVQNTYIAKFDYHLKDNHTLFVRGNLQNDSADNGSTNAPQFPGLPANSVSLANSKGLAAGWTGVLKPTLVSTFRYGLTRAGNQNTGVLTSNYEWFRGYDTPYGTSTGLSRIVPVHTFSEDLSWNHGAHDVRFGVVARLISNSSLSYAHSFSSASSNPSWLKGSGSDLAPATLGLSKGDTQSFQYGMGALLGLEVQGNANYNYMVDGTLLTPGLPVARDFVNHEGEFYVQDTWKVTRTLTVTGGVRLSLAPPVYESNGQQASTNIPLANWLAQRSILADQGLSQMGAGLVTFVPENQGRPMYPYHKNWAPRLGIAYSPIADSGLSKFLFGGPGKTSIRVGAGMYYDVIGQPLAQLFNATAFGLASSLTSPPNILTTSEVPRYTGFYTVPGAIVPPAPAGGLPRTYPTSGAGSFAITNSIDDALKAPYTINLDLSIGRELGHGFFVQGSYVGRLSRHSLVNQDLAMPTNLKDPKSGQTYFQAMTQLATLLDLQGVKIQNLPKIPFFENLWSHAAGNGMTATQVWANDYLHNSNPGDFSNTLNNADNGANCNPGSTLFNAAGNVNAMACGDQGPFMIFNPQFSALSAYSSIGIGDYHAMQWTIRKRFSNGLLFDLNYTFSKSIDLGSTSEAGTCNPTCNPAGASFSGFIQNTWNPSQMRGVSSYDTTHQVNAYGVYQLPLGRGMKFGANMNRVLDALVGGWQISGTYRQTSGLPFSMGNGQRWPTNWEVSDIATPNGQPLPIAVSTGNSNAGSPNLWQDPKAAFAAFQETLPGQSGSRNTMRGSGFFDIDTGVYKTFTMPYSEHHHLTIRWESYNLTNSVRFDPTCGGSSYGTGCGNTLSSSSFGKLNTLLVQPRQMQFAARYTW